MTFLESLKETLDSGDPTVQTWPLVSSYTLPFVLTFMYVAFVKVVGPFIMHERKPFNLRVPMILYNLLIVALYTWSLYTILYAFVTTDATTKLCSQTVVTKEDYTYGIAAAGWIIYIVKYMEYADTIFFILRKKYHLITNLHVIHHAALPLIGWILFRTERSGFQFLPSCINALVHVAMYSYYAMAAIGPEVRQHLWWKAHLTKFQMVQFVVILLMVLIAVPMGCTTTQHGMYIDSFCAVMFFSLFYNFYVKTYIAPKKGKKAPSEHSKDVVKNGSSHSKRQSAKNAKKENGWYWKDFISGGCYEGSRGE